MASDISTLVAPDGKPAQVLAVDAESTALIFKAGPPTAGLTVTVAAEGRSPDERAEAVKVAASAVAAWAEREAKLG
jgi:hypothetical protein